MITLHIASKNIGGQTVLGIDTLRRMALPASLRDILGRNPREDPFDSVDVMLAVAIGADGSIPAARGQGLSVDPPRIFFKFLLVALPAGLRDIGPV